MRVLVDTSAWVEFFNGTGSPEHRAVARLISGQDEICTCGVIVAELFQGFRRKRGRNKLQELFRELVFLEPDGIDLYFRAAELHRTLRENGLTVRSTIDCLVAALAEANECYILARDRDLSLILQQGLVKTLHWPLE